MNKCLMYLSILMIVISITITCGCGNNESAGQETAGITTESGTLMKEPEMTAEESGDAFGTDNGSDAETEGDPETFEVNATGTAEQTGTASIETTAANDADKTGYIRITVDTSFDAAPPDESKNGLYTIEEHNGQYYLVFFKSASESLSAASQECKAQSVLRFDSIDVLLEKLEKGTFTEEELRTINEFTKDECGVKIFDPSSSIRISYPDGLIPDELGLVAWYGESVGYSLYDADNDLQISAETMSEVNYNAKIKRYNDMKYAKGRTILSETTTNEGVTETVIKSEFVGGYTMYKLIEYELSGKSVYEEYTLYSIKEEYSIEDIYNKDAEPHIVRKEGSESIPTEVTVLYSTDGEYFIVTFHTYKRVKPSAELLNGIDFRK